MTTRRRREPRTFEDCPRLDTYCADCLRRGISEVQRQTPSGPTCKFGHGGADGVHIGVDVSIPRHDFEVREGDSLVVTYGGVKLQIAPFSTVEIGSAIYSRKMEPGDDPSAEFEKIHAFLEKQVTSRAKTKLATFATELAKAKARAAGK